MNLIIISLFLTVMVFAKANTTTPTLIKQIKSFSSELDSLKDLSADQYLQEISSFQIKLEQYILKKTRFCKKGFPTSILINKGYSIKETRTVYKKLTKKERTLCLKELKEKQIKFIKNSFIARKRFLDKIHKKRIDELTQLRDSSIKTLQPRSIKSRQRKSKN